MLTTVLLALVHASILIEPVGFSVVRDGVDVKVDWVEPTSPAAKAGLEVGTVILGVQGPAPRAGKELGKLDDVALRELLTPPYFEPLRLFVKPVKGFTSRVMLSRTDPVPADYYARLPWPAERVARLTSQERSMYDAQLRLAELKAPAADSQRGLQLEEAVLKVTVTTGPRPALKAIERGEFNAEVITWAGTFNARCGGAGVEQLKVLEPAGLAPVRDLAKTAKLEARWPLFKTADALAACASGKPAVVLQQPLKLELACAGGSPFSSTVTAFLRVECVAP